MGEPLKTDLLVIGAGPSGCAAAITAFEAGLDVIVVDKSKFPRDKTCGDGLTTSALRKFEQLGLDPTTVESWHHVDDVRVAGPGGTSVIFPLPRGRGQFAAVAKRIDLDDALVRRAREVGVTVLEDTPLTDVAQTPTSVIAVAGGTEIQANYLIAADGMFSPTRKLSGISVGPQLGDWHAFRQYFTGVTGPGSSELFVSFEHDLLPGYFWSFPLGDGRANVGFGIERGRRYKTQDMKHLWVDLLNRPHIRELLGPDAEPVGAHKAWPIPASIDKAVTSYGRILFVGDAIAACDPMSGEGIGQALQSGIAAAEVIARHGDDANAVALTYDQTISAALVADHKMSALLVRALQHRKGARRALQVAGTSAWTRKNFARWLFEDYPRAVLFTPKRWHRKLFTSDGAYK